MPRLFRGVRGDVALCICEKKGEATSPLQRMFCVEYG